MSKQSVQITVDHQGRLILPPEISQRFGLEPGSTTQIEIMEDRFQIVRSHHQLARVYIEPTNICNLDCSTCMRNVWDEPLGRMSAKTFERIVQSVRMMTPRPTIFFGGFGEPLAHPELMFMVAAFKSIRAKVELITNGILLTEEIARQMIDLGLNRLWVSIDGATPESYADVRLGDALPQVIDNLSRLRDLRLSTDACLPRLGIAFVAMQRNIADLPAVVQLGKTLGADQFSISNVLPHTAELQAQILYTRSLRDEALQPSRWAPAISLPRIDLDIQTLKSLAGVLENNNTLRIAGQDLTMGVRTCPFIAKGSVSIRWDGSVSPCLALLHSHQAYLDRTRRKSQAFEVGKLDEHTLLEIWNLPEYAALRKRLQDFDFSPCAYCNTCEMAEGNLEDCFGNTQPACGGCLWVQGFIQCP